eukprot:scaffold1.g5871.t1
MRFSRSTKEARFQRCLEEQLAGILSAAAADEAELARLGGELAAQQACAASAQAALERVQRQVEAAREELERSYGEAEAQRQLAQARLARVNDLEAQLSGAEAAAEAACAAGADAQRRLAAADARADGQHMAAEAAEDAARTAHEEAAAAEAAARREAATAAEAGRELAACEDHALALQIELEDAQAAASAHRREAARLAAALDAEQQLHHQLSEGLSAAEARVHALEAAAADEAMRADTATAQVAALEHQAAAERARADGAEQRVGALRGELDEAAASAARAAAEAAALLQAERAEARRLRSAWQRARARLAEFGERLDRTCAEQQVAGAGMDAQGPEPLLGGEATEEVLPTSEGSGSAGASPSDSMNSGRSSLAADAGGSCGVGGPSPAACAPAGGAVPVLELQRTVASAGCASLQRISEISEVPGPGRWASAGAGAGAWGSPLRPASPAACSAAGLQARVAALEAELAVAQERASMAAVVAREAVQRLLADAARVAQEGKQARLTLGRRVRELEGTLAAAEVRAEATAEEAFRVQERAAEVEDHFALVVSHVERLEARLARRVALDSSAGADVQARMVLAVRASMELQERWRCERAAWAAARRQYVARQAGWRHLAARQLLLMRCLTAWRSRVQQLQLASARARAAAAERAARAARGGGAGAGEVKRQSPPEAEGTQAAVADNARGDFAIWAVPVQAARSLQRSDSGAAAAGLRGSAQQQPSSQAVFDLLRKESSLRLLQAGLGLGQEGETGGVGARRGGRGSGAGSVRVAASADGSGSSSLGVPSSMQQEQDRVQLGASSSGAEAGLADSSQYLSAISALVTSAASLGCSAGAEATAAAAAAEARQEGPLPAPLPAAGQAQLASPAAPCAFAAIERDGPLSEQQQPQASLEEQRPQASPGQQRRQPASRKAPKDAKRLMLTGSRLCG